MAKKKQSRGAILLLVFVVFVVGVTAGSYLFPTTSPSQVPLSQFSVDTTGYIPITVNAVGSDIIMSSTCHSLRITISDIQALSIANGLEKRIGIRPLTQDIMKDIFDNYGFHVLAARVTSFKEGIYYGDLTIQQGNKVLNVDSRPSDAIAVAVRYDVPIYFNESLLKEHGTNNC